jgi:hypothetical protein
MGDNGLPIDGIATISGSYIFIEDKVNSLSYTAGSSTVTLPAGADLTPVTTAKNRYTGRYVLITNDGQILYINRQSIDIGARTFTVSRSDSSQITPVSIDLTPGWKVAEADIVNRMATTSAAKIDSVEFRDMQFQLQLDGDPVTLLNQDGEGINPATEEKQDDQVAQLGLINDELDTQTIQLEQLTLDLNSQSDETQLILQTELDEANTSLDSIDNKLTNDYGTSVEALRTASQIGNSSGGADFDNGATTAQTLRTSSNITDEAGAAFTDINYLPSGQSTHDNHNVNANLQINDTDVAEANAIPARVMNKLVTERHDDIVLTRDPVTFDITQAEFKLGGSTVATVIYEYDAFENLIRAYRA